MSLMLNTTRGEMPVCLLTKQVVITDYADAEVVDTQYRIGSELVRNDVVLNLKGKDFGFTQATL